MPWSEFLEWLAYLEHEETRRTKYEFYLAQIAAQIAATSGVKSTLEDFFIHWEVPLTPVEKMMLSKRAWADMLGIELPE